MSTYILKFDEPATLTLQSADDAKKVVVDVYETRRFLEECQAQPNETARWKKVNEWIGKQLGVDASLIRENQGQQLQAAINVLVGEFNDRLKKSVASIVSSPLLTQESPTTSSPGP